MVINSSYDNNLVYINGLQFNYNGIYGKLHGIKNISISNTIFKNTYHSYIDTSIFKVKEIIIYQSFNNKHIVGLSFLSGNIYYNIGNTTNNINNSLIISKKINYKNFIFSGISGHYGILLIDKNIIAIMDINILLIKKKGQFAGGEKHTIYVRIGLLINGLWWLIFSSISIKYLKKRNGPILPINNNININNNKYKYYLNISCKTKKKKISILISRCLY